MYQQFLIHSYKPIKIYLHLVFISMVIILSNYKLKLVKNKIETMHTHSNYKTFTKSLIKSETIYVSELHPRLVVFPLLSAAKFAQSRLLLLTLSSPYHGNMALLLLFVRLNFQIQGCRGGTRLKEEKPGHQGTIY